ncbi:MAG TPA: hypothetical protein VM198_14010 [Longimicrobiales bacterium]|nr:hypothetical protein [Longimicrobiales bacterium]
MSALLPRVSTGGLPEPEYPRLQHRPLSDSERRARWEVRAAQWRARELAELAFGRVGESVLVGAMADGPLRGLLRLGVPFADLDQHREREACFMAAVAADPVLAHIRLVYVVGPEAD